MSINSSSPRPTRRDVALRAGVSGTTVSRVFSGNEDASISPTARERVLQAARELGYTPNSAAKALRSGRSGLLGIWMCLELSLYRSRVLAELRSLLAETEYALAVTDVDEDYAWHRSIDRALRVPVEGVIAFDASTASHAFLADSDRLAPNLPFVSMGAFWSDQRSYVGVDLKAGSIAAVEHLLQMGRRRIAHLVPQGTWFVTAGDRYDGYVETVLSSGCEPLVVPVDDNPAVRIECIREALLTLRAQNQLPDALFCFYDEMAIDAIRAVERIGLVPGVDIALVGVNGSEGLDRLSCPLTTVRQPIEPMCTLALQFLQDQIDEPGRPLQQAILKPELIIRASSTLR